MAGISQHKAAEYFEYYVLMALQAAGVTVSADMRTELAEAASAFQDRTAMSLDAQIAALLSDPNSRVSRAVARNTTAKLARA